MNLRLCLLICGISSVFCIPFAAAEKESSSNSKKLPQPAKDEMFVDDEEEGSGNGDRDDMQSSGSGFGDDDEDAEIKPNLIVPKIEGKKLTTPSSVETTEQPTLPPVVKTEAPKTETQSPITTTVFQIVESTTKKAEEYTDPPWKKLTLAETTTIAIIPEKTTEDTSYGSGNGIRYIPHDKSHTSFFAQPGILAAIIGGAVVGLLFAILVVMFIVYRMKKKDEGSYALEEMKRSPAANPYVKPNHREFFA